MNRLNGSYRQAVAQACGCLRRRLVLDQVVLPSGLQSLSFPERGFVLALLGQREDVVQSLLLSGGQRGDIRGVLGSGHSNPELREQHEEGQGDRTRCLD